MKKIEQLGISPAPWITGEEDTTHLVLNKTDVYCKYTKKDGVQSERIVSTVNHWFAESANDSKLIAAAPELYEALWDLFFGNNGCCRVCKGHELGNCQICPRGEARAALEKAGGKA